ncbi:MAG: glycosyltransferase family 2 protein [Bacteroidales bacterium]|nr:glycosyltransferase family 2 protein [Bacteroidales bacterium]
MISFIIPIYNAEPYLVRCIHSVLKQTTSEPLQVILVDDGSTDNSLAIAQEAAREEKRIVVLRQPHAGQSAARNLGLKHAQGEYVAFVDADDTIAPDWCEKHVEAIEGVDYVQSGNPRNRYQYTVVWNRLYRREAITGLSFPEGVIYEDVLWSVDLWLSKASCRVIRYNGYHYTANPESTTAHSHPEAQKRVLLALRAKRKGASMRGKFIIAYTICRLKLHFIRS